MAHPSRVHRTPPQVLEPNSGVCSSNQSSGFLLEYTIHRTSSENIEVIKASYQIHLQAFTAGERELSLHSCHLRICLSAFLYILLLKPLLLRHTPHHLASGPDVWDTRNKEQQIPGRLEKRAKFRSTFHTLSWNIRLNLEDDSQTEPGEASLESCSLPASQSSVIFQGLKPLTLLLNCHCKAESGSRHSFCRISLTWRLYFFSEYTDFQHLVSPE